MPEDVCTFEAVAALIKVARAAEGRNSTTRHHSERVAMIARGMAEELGWSEERLDRLQLIGRLHNLGIVGTRDSVLLKTEKLTAEEFAHIQEHTRLGAKLLAPMPDLDDVAEVCLRHHERWNGTGYPDGLKGEEIPETARIIAVADVFCAITSERPHRDSMPAVVAADMIEEERGKKHCPTAVDAFLKWFEAADDVDLK